MKANYIKYVTLDWPQDWMDRYTFDEDPFENYLTVPYRDLRILNIHHILSAGSERSGKDVKVAPGADLDAFIAAYLAYFGHEADDFNRELFWKECVTINKYVNDELDDDFEDDLEDTLDDELNDDL